MAILVEMLSSFAMTFENMNIEEKRAALRRVIQRIEYHSDENLKIYFTGYQLEPQGEDSKCNHRIAASSGQEVAP